ncbi:hypothetical protein F6450_10950 [Photobacterium damselae subsp. damselae]|uniref:Uncharacterized protein n=1 Tax=Photobacterium damselae subsp. damselae TaxID=85581 RepID=A0AAD3WXP3_PHODD|nr:hypothetical protein F6450_10950 [Photobacterium damselae subsp. damselae]
MRLKSILVWFGLVWFGLVWFGSVTLVNCVISNTTKCICGRLINTTYHKDNCYSKAGYFFTKYLLIMLLNIPFRAYLHLHGRPLGK